MFETPEDRSYLVDVSDGLLTLTFNRPEFGNALPSTAVPSLMQLFEQAQMDLAIRCILVRGEGKMFSAGGDVAGFGRSLEQDVSDRQADFRIRLERLQRLVEAVVTFDRPIVAAVRGAAAGAGLLYPLAADVVIGDETATFVFAHRRIGLSPDGGVSYLLPRLVGARMARMLLLTAAKVEAKQALDLGLLSRIVPADEFERNSRVIAEELARAPLTAVRHTKALANAGYDTSLTNQLQAETEAIVECVGDPDFAEGVRAFLERRPARFGQQPPAAN